MACCVVVPNHSEQHVSGNFVAASPLCVAFSRRPEDHAPRTALREKIRAQREQCGSIENQKKPQKPKKQKIKKTIFRNSVKYIWIRPESCNIVFAAFFVFLFFGFVAFLFFFLVFFVFWLDFQVLVALCIQECGTRVIVYSGVGAWECVKHEKNALSQCPVLFILGLNYKGFFRVKFLNGTSRGAPRHQQLPACFLKHNRSDPSSSKPSFSKQAPINYLKGVLCFTDETLLSMDFIVQNSRRSEKHFFL